MKVLVTAQFTEEGIKRLAALDMEIIYDPWTRRNKLLLSHELAERIKEVGAEAVIIEIDLCHEEVFEQCGLKFVGCCRGDPLVVDLDEATDRGIPVFFTPGRNAEAVADLAIACMLSHLRGLIAIVNDLKSGKFNPQSPSEFMELFQKMSGHELGGRKVGIIGIGAVGAAVARRVRGFGSRMIAYDPFAPQDLFTDLGVEKVELEGLFRAADIITLHAAATDENEGMITREMIESMKPDAFFINLARAELVDNDALYQALEQGNIAGAAIDVYMSEPPSSEDRFVGLDNVIATPHIGGASLDVVRRQTDTLIDDIEAFIKGNKPRYCANPEVLERD